jgi:hypothetical protein
VGYSFDGPNKRINLSAGTTTMNVRDVWSRWVDWAALSDNSKYLPAFVTIGGNDIDPAEGTKVPVFAFLINGWRIKPQEADHTLSVPGGILLVDGGGDPFANTDGDYVVRINYQQPVQAISFATSGGEAPTAEEIANQVWSQVLVGSITASQMMQIIGAVLAAKTSGGGTALFKVRNLEDTEDLITAAVDPATGDRLTVTIAL